MKFTDKTCEEFAAVLSTKAPVPGGGGASAFVGALGVALGNMVGNLTIGKKKYAQVEEEMIELNQRCEQLRGELLNLVEEDAKVFEPLSNVYRMPKETEEEKALKEAMMEKALLAASKVPLEIMEKCCEAIELMKVYAEKGSVMAISDAGVGASFSKAALMSASLNVYINTKSMKNRVCAQELNQKVTDMLQAYVPMADQIFAEVTERLKN